MRKIEKHHLKLNNREVTNFLHNAQLSLCDQVSDEVIPALHAYSKLLLSLMTEDSTFTRVELACVAASVAYAAWETREQ